MKSKANLQPNLSGVAPPAKSVIETTPTSEERKLAKVAASAGKFGQGRLQPQYLV
jgi:hypothetical protein